MVEWVKREESFRFLWSVLEGVLSYLVTFFKAQGVILLVIAVLRQCRKYFPGGAAVTGIINLIVFSNYDIGGFIFQIQCHLIQIIRILQPGRIFLDLLSYFLQHFLRNAAVIFYRVYIGCVIAVKKPVRRFCILYMAAHHQKRNTCEQKRQQHHRQ